MRAWLLVPLALTSMVACGGPARRSPASQSDDGATVAGGASGGAVVAAAESCVAPPPPASPSGRARAAALAAMLDGRPHAARAALEGVVRDDPRDLASQALVIAADELVARAQVRVAEEADRRDPVRLAAIPLAQHTHTTLDLADDPVRVERVSEEKNLITDDADWLAKVGVVPPARRVAPGVLPAHAASALRGRGAHEVFAHADHTAVTYGNVLGVFAPGKVPLVFELSRAARTEGRGLDVGFAQLVGKTLVMQLAYNGYAKEAAGKNGFVTAFDAETGALLWSSEPLVSNASNFVIRGSRLITGYGFTAEPDHLFVLDLRTGKVDQRVPLRSGPDAILSKGDQLFVRTYDTNYVFRMTGGRAAAAPALADARSEGATALSPDARCWLDAAVAAVDARDAKAAERGVVGFRTAGGPEPIAKALEGTQRFLAQQAAAPVGQRAIDPTTVAPLVIPAPPWERSFTGPEAGPPPRTVRLVRASSQVVDPVAAMNATRGDPAPGEPAFIAPVDKGKLPRSVRQDIPSSYAEQSLRAIIPSGDRLLLVYGGRYVVIVRGDTTEHVLDLDAFRHPPRANPQWKEFAVQDVTYAQVVDGVLYVENGGGSYAREVFGKKGFVSAIDLASKKLLWRSDPLVGNGTFAVVGDLLVTGYGFTDEPDALFVLWSKTGERLAKHPLDSGPDRIRAKATPTGARLHVIAYGHVYEVDLLR